MDIDETKGCPTFYRVKTDLSIESAEQKCNFDRPCEARLDRLKAESAAVSIT